MQRDWQQSGVSIVTNGRYNLDNVSFANDALEEKEEEEEVEQKGLEHAPRDI
mgnify:CR=1 FL=1